ncbi:MAG: peptidase, partial [Verrucomicrobia bacterium]|nr:peptidase [Verrucomicrobiota bacterium]
VVWLAYTIHGDETEGADAALAMLYHLVAAENQDVKALLRDLVIIIDPLMNPDGRARFIKMIAEARAATPNVDEQSLLHTGYWPRGRGNHYLFDLNRDWILGVHPETRGRIREVAKWNPVLFVDAHGMGAQATHLFSPPREPINPNLPRERLAWGETFAKDQARAFDRAGLLYYNGEWHEEWYPGYSDAYASYRGAVGILYEQARIAEDGVLRPEGRILNYHDSVRHHLIGNLANLRTARRHAKELLRALRKTREEAMSPEGPYADRIFAVLPTEHAARLNRFLDLMRLQGIETYRTVAPFVAVEATDPFGRERRACEIPEGAILIPNRQPLGHLVAAMLEFDPHFPENVLREERASILDGRGSRIYDTTAWSLFLFYDLPALTLRTPWPEQAVEKANRIEEVEGGVRPSRARPVAYLIDGADDRSVTAAARLLERGVRVRLALKPLRFEGNQYARGSLLITRLDNQTFSGNLQAVLEKTCRETGLQAVPLQTGRGLGDWPDLGGGYFRLLTRPRIALVGREASSAYDYGACWFLLDHTLAIRHSHLAGGLSGDLRRYNVIVLPGGRGVSPSAELKEWVRQGGTLIAFAGATRPLISSNAGFSHVRGFDEALADLDRYDQALIREWLAQAKGIPPLPELWSHRVPSGIGYPWSGEEAKRPALEELRRRSRWDSLFMPAGAFLAARVNTNHWLTVGCGTRLPVLVGRGPVLMAAEGVEAPVRYGVIETSGETSREAAKAEGQGAEASEKTAPSPAGKAAFRRTGYTVIPKNGRAVLRIGGLLWPEGARKLLNAAWCARERYGRGQIILFATSPVFRGAALGAQRVFLNALVYGPGCGARAPILP